MTLSISHRFAAKAPPRRGATRRAWLPALVMAAALSLPAMAQTQDENAPKAFGDWYLRCGKINQDVDESCVLLQDVIDNNSNKPLMQLAVGFWGPEKQRGALITLPLGIRLPPGIQIKVDSVEVGKVPFSQCGLNGCQVHVTMDDTLLKKFKAGIGGTVAFYDATGRVVPVPFSLKGFTAGFAEVH